MRVPRLSPHWCNRLIVVLLALAPIVYLFGIYFCGLLGSHQSTGLDLTLIQSFFNNDNNFVTNIGENICSAPSTVYGFRPFAYFLEYIDTNMLGFYSNDVWWGLFLYGYSYWIMHVLLLDLAVYAVTFIIRIFKMILHRFERGVE